MFAYIFAAAKDIQQVDITGNLIEVAKDRFSKYLSYIRVIDGHRNYLITRRHHIFWDVKRRLISSRLGLNAEYRDRSGVLQQFPYLIVGCQQIFFPVHRFKFSYLTLLTASVK